MKKHFLFALFSIITIYLFAIDAKYTGAHYYEDHNHYYYELQLDATAHNPIWVKWTLTNDEAIEAEAVNNRTNDFRKCDVAATKSSTKKDYDKSGFDRGHQCPSNDMDFSVDGASATFYMCNICPQTKALNRGIWKKYETYGHTLAKKYGKVTIICGPMYDDTLTPTYIGSTLVRVPDGFFKVFYYTDADNNDIVECFKFSQANNSPENTTLEEILKLTDVQISK